MARDAFYARMAETANRLIGKYDQGSVSAVIETVVPRVSPYDPPTITTTLVPVKIVARGVSASLATADPNLVATDVMLIVDGSQDYKPAVGDKVQLNGDAKVVVRVDRVPAAGDPIIYKFFVR